MTLQPLVPKVGEHNMRRVSEVERIGKVRGVEKIEKMREVKKAIGEIR